MGLSINEIKTRTVDYRSPSCRASLLSWRVGEVETIGNPDAQECGLMLLGDRKTGVGDLPTELFNHQLLSCDCSSFESLRGFVAEWGFPYSPFRYHPLGTRVLARGSARREADDAMRITDSLRRDMRPVISIAEVKHSIGCFQWMVGELRKAIFGAEHADFTQMLNAATCNEFVAANVEGSKLVVTRKIPLGHYWETERLSCAIANQMVAALADEKPWRLCACEGCGTLFKRKQSSAESRYARGNSVYCCEKCQQRQKKRNQSRSAKNRIDHGL